MAKTALRDTNLVGAKFFGADLQGKDFHGVDFTGADFARADCLGSDFSGANLAMANLSGADFRVATLVGAILVGANLTGANLGGADLTGADLTGAILDEADLRQVNFTRTILIGVTGLSEEVLAKAKSEGAITTCEELLQAWQDGHLLHTASSMAEAIEFLTEKEADETTKALYHATAQTLNGGKLHVQSRIATTAKVAEKETGLPSELVEHIFSFLPEEDAPTLASVSKAGIGPLLPLGADKTLTNEQGKADLRKTFVERYGNRPETKERGK